MLTAKASQHFFSGARGVRVRNQPSSSYPSSVFEYHGFSGEGPPDLFIEEQLLQPRAPPQARVRMRAALREPQPRTTSTAGGDNREARNPAEGEPTTPGGGLRSLGAFMRRGG